MRRIRGARRLAEAPVLEGAARGLGLRRDSAYRRALVAADLLCAVLALVLVVPVLSDDGFAPGALAAVALIPLVAKALGLYDRDEFRMRQTTLEEAPSLFHVAAMFALGVWLAGPLVVDGYLSRTQALVLCGVLTVAMLAGRKATRRLVREVMPGERCLVLGGADAAELAERSLNETHRVTATVVGRVPLEPGESRAGAAPVLGSLRAIATVLERHAIDRVLIAPRRSDSDQILDAVRLGKTLGVKVSVLPHLLEVVGSAVEFDELEGLTLLQVPRHALARSSARLKRAFDLTIASIALLALAPFLVMVALAVKLGSGRGPVLVRERRLGQRGAPFELLRFATAVPGAEDAWRWGRRHRTPVGRLLRRGSLEELPQLLNVLRGEMSLVGPRAPMPHEEHYATSLDMLPGVTGRWRIFGSTRLSVEEMAKIDYLYGVSWSLWLDIRIMLRTIPAVWRQRDGETGLLAPSTDGDDGAPEVRRMVVGRAPTPSGQGLVVTEQAPSASALVSVAERRRVEQRDGPPVAAGANPAAELGSLSLTAIVLATNAPPTLDRCTRAIHDAQASFDELIVVENSPNVGPADARNHAALSATGDLLVFIDADVVIAEDAFSRIRTAFEADPELTALIGSFDEGIDSLGKVGKFRNLLNHHVHTNSAGPVPSFWTGLGAVRREAFSAAGGFDADRFRTPAIEDVELGMRLSAGGARILLDPQIRGTHLKDWGFAEMVRTDYQERAVPWIALLLRDGGVPSTTLNLGWRQRASAVVSVAGLAAVLGRRPLAAGGSLLGFLGLNLSFYRLLARRHGPSTAAAGVGLHLLHHLVAVAAVPAGATRYLAERRRGGTAERPDEGAPQRVGSLFRRAARATSAMNHVLVTKYRRSSRRGS